MVKKYDFSGWATRANIRCSDGRIIMKDAFADNDGLEVPLVWNHCHNDPNNVLGHALLQNRDEGVYAYCSFNDTESGKTAKSLVEHGDVKALSIYANKLKQEAGKVLHGAIREVSLVVAGANPGAYIDNICHGADNYTEDQAVVYYNSDSDGIDYLELKHGEVEVPEKKKEEPKVAEEEKKSPEQDSEETVQDVVNSMSEKQKTVMYALIGEALKDAGKGDDNKDDSKEEDSNVKHNVFESDEQDNREVLSHSEMTDIFNEAARGKSLKDVCIAHNVDLDSLNNNAMAHADSYGINDIDYLFPDAKNYTTTPQFIDRQQGWVSTFMNGVHHTPFSRIKTMFADITADEARARGYTKGKKKVEEVFGLLKRVTTPQTIYKKQKLDRDDIIDITDFDVVAWLRGEMRGKLNEEIARAALIGDGRSEGSDDKINETNIRPIWTDDELYTIHTAIAESTDGVSASDFIDGVFTAMTDYEGSGNPTMFITKEMLTKCLLVKDLNGRRIYKDVSELASAMMVGRIVMVPVMSGQSRSVEYTSGSTRDQKLLAIIVNLNDYNIGADKGGAVSMFDDFDIDYNQQKYLIETRCSGAMVKPKAAIAVESYAATTSSGS